MWRKLKIGLFEFRSINYYNNNNARKARKEARNYKNQKRLDENLQHWNFSKTLSKWHPDQQ